MWVYRKLAISRVWPRHRSLLLTVGAWIAVRIVQWVSGATYSDAFLDWGWQLVPRDTLRHHLLGSVWYLHVQPPLYNLTIGIILRWSPLSDRASTQLLVLACSVLAAVGLQRLAVLLGFTERMAIVLATVVMADPYMIRYELEPTYEIPVLAMIVWTLLLVHRAAAKPTVGRFAVAGGALAAIVLTRSLFHPLWLAVIVVALVRAVPRVAWRSIAVVTGIPLLFVGTWMIKNDVLFGEATLSSWLGMNMERGVIAPLPAGDVEEMLAKGEIGEIAAVPPFLDYDSYAPYVEPCTPAHRQPAVSQPLRPSGTADYNYECFIPVYAAMFDASIDAVRHDPGGYLASRLDAIHFSTDHPLEVGYGQATMRVVRVFYRVAFVDVHRDVDMSSWFHPLFGPGLVIAYPSMVVVAALLLCCWELVRGGRQVLTRRATPEDLLLAIGAFTVLWIVITGALVEMGENARFRAIVHPVLILVAVAAAKRLPWARLRWARRGLRG